MPTLRPGYGPSDPAPWIKRFAGLVAAGTPVLDVACGQGRHGRLFLDLGHPVTAIDRDVSGLADIAGRDGLEIIETDLEDGSPWPLDGRTFGAVVVVNYLHRPLFPVLVRSLAPGGVLIYSTFAQGNEKYGRPANPDHLLRPNELLEAFTPHLLVLAYEFGKTTNCKPAIRESICAQNPG